MNHNDYTPAVPPAETGNPEVDAMIALDRYVFQALTGPQQDRVIAWMTNRRRDEKAEAA